MEPTRITLLQKVKDPNNQKAWEEFFRLYWDPILRFARKKGMDEHTARDVLQETMVILMDLLRTFEYNPETGRFRNYVFTITQRVALKHSRRAYRHREVSMQAPLGGEEGFTLEDLLEDPKAGSSTQKSDHEAWVAGILDKALEELRGEAGIKPQSIEIFIAVKRREEDPADVAARHGMQRNAVDQVVHRIKARLAEKLRDYQDSLLD